MADETQGRASFLYRWRWRIVLLLLLVRVALPEVIRRVVVSQASKRLETRVEVGDVDLSFLRGGVALEDVAIHSPTPQAPNEPPLVAWKRFAVSVRYFPLLWKTVQVREIDLEGPHVALDRLANGEVNLQKLVPRSEPAAAPAAKAEPEKKAESGTEPEPGKPAPTASGWKIGVDRFVLRAGGIRFRDLMVAEGEPLEIAIPDIAVDEIALQPGLYGEPGKARVVVRTEGGSVRVDSQLWALDRGFALGTRVKAYRLPLRRARLYVPGVGWSELKGEIDAAVDYGLAPGTRNEVRGTVRLRDVTIRVPDLVDAAFSLKHFAVRVDPIDLAAHNARVAEVDIAGLSVVVNLQGGDVLPLLAKRGKTPAPGAAGGAGEEAPPAEEGPPGKEVPSAGEAPPAKAPPAAEVPPPARTPPAADAPPTEVVPWHWRFETVRLADSQVSLVQEDKPLDIGLAATLRRLADKGPPGRVTLDLTVAPGSVAIAGALRAIPPAFGGTVKIEQLPVHELIRAARAAAQLAPGLTKHALLGVDLAVEAGVTAKGEAAAPADTVRVSGTIGVDGLEVSGDDPKVFGVTMKRFALPIDKLELPGLVPGAPADAPKGPIHVALGAVRLEEPAVQATRTAEGIVLPPQLGGGAAKPAEPAPASSAEPAPAPASPPPAAGAAPPVDVTIASLVLQHGRVGFTDQSVKPFFTGQLQPIELDARGIKAAGPVIDKFTLALGTPGKGKIDASGSLRPGGGKIEVNGKEVALAPYNPYVTSFSPYSIGRNATLSVRTNVDIGKNKYDSKTALTLHKLTVKGAAGDTIFKQQFGIPLSVALALLRDLQGNIKLDIPVGVDEKGATVGVGTVVAGALRSALVGAVTSPLKMIGSVMGEGDAGISEPPPIAFQTGRTVLTDEGEKQVGQIAEFLSARPGVALELDGVVTATDTRWLAEQDLRAEFEARTGVMNALRGLPERRQRNRVVAALAERAEDKPGELDEDDRAKLDQWLGERPAVPVDRLRDLARSRTETVQAALRDKHGIPVERVTLDDPKGETREGVPSVVIGFGSVGD